jgi:hypothetical protein
MSLPEKLPSHHGDPLDVLLVVALEYECYVPADVAVYLAVWFYKRLHLLSRAGISVFIVRYLEPVELSRCIVCISLDDRTCAGDFYIHCCVCTVSGVYLVSYSVFWGPYRQEQSDQDFKPTCRLRLERKIDSGWS